MDKNFVEYEAVSNFKHKNKAAILEYISLMYDKKSKLNKIENLEERKLKACSQAKLDSKEEWVIEMMAMKVQEINYLVFIYMGYYQNSNKLHKLLSDQQLFWDMQMKVMDPATPMKERMEMSKASDKLLPMIDKGLSEIFGSDDVVNAAEEEIRKIQSLETRLKKAG